MAIVKEDYDLIREFKARHNKGSSCAILGDCRITGDLKDLGFDVVDTFDILGNPTHKVDLNKPLEAEHLGKYDWVIDSGTLYCCFNPAMVLQNITNMLKDTGYCLHTSNLCGWFGRGFYSVSPSLYKEFYELNNFKIEGMGTKTKASNRWDSINRKGTYLSYASTDSMQFSEEPSPYISGIPNDTLLYCFVSRETKVPFKQPTPEHYIRTDGQ